jgi:hypothetical protein
MLTLTACDRFTSSPPVVGSGTSETQTRPVTDFTAIAISGQGIVNLTQGDAHALVITADDNLQPLLTSTVDGSTLNLGVERGKSIDAVTPIVYDITVPALTELRISGSANVNFDAFDGDELALFISGSGTVAAADLQLTAFDVEVSGTGGVVVAGSADSLHVNYTGSGAFDGEAFPVTDAVVEMTGSANVIVNASATLDANIGGSGVVSYIGAPQVTQRISGAGVVRAR